MERLVSLVSMIVISASILAVGASPAGATFPGGNGEIAYVTQKGTVRAVLSDGTGDHRLGSASDVQYSPDGSTIVLVEDSRHGARIVQQDLVTGDRSVIVKRTDLPKHFIDSVAFAPDGASVVFCAQRGTSHLYTVNVDGSGLAEVPSTKGYCYADWSVDDRIVASKGIFKQDGDRLVTTMDPDGSNQEIIATLPPVKGAWDLIYFLVPSWAPDGSAVAFTAQHHRIYPDIWAVNADGSGLRKLTDTRRGAESGPVYSPDGALMAFEPGSPAFRQVRPLADGRRRVGPNADHGHSWPERVLAFVAVHVVVTSRDGSGLVCLL